VGPQRVMVEVKPRV